MLIIPKEVLNDNNFELILFVAKEHEHYLELSQAVTRQFKENKVPYFKIYNTIIDLYEYNESLEYVSKLRHITNYSEWAKIQADRYLQARLLRLL